MSSSKTFFFIRMVRQSDIPDCRAVDVKAWGEEGAATEEMLISRVKTCPFGNFLAIDRASGEIIGSVWSFPIGEIPVTTWWGVTGEGEYGDALEVFGEVQYGVNVSVEPALLGRGVGEVLVARAIESGWIAGRRWAMLGSRIPEFHKWSDIIEPDDYVCLYLGNGRTYYRNPESGCLHEGPEADTLRASAGDSGLTPKLWPISASEPDKLTALDGELNFFLRISVRGEACKVFKVLPDYFPDPESCDYGALIGWENQDHPDCSD